MRILNELGILMIENLLGSLVHACESAIQIRKQNSAAHTNRETEQCARDMDRVEMTVRKSSIFMDRAFMDQELDRAAVSSSLVMPTNSQQYLRNKKVSVKKIKR